MRIVAARSRARRSIPSYNENRPYWNLGCANQRNLAAMVANPADLVQPRGEGQRLRPSAAPIVVEQVPQGAEHAPPTTPNPTRGKLSDVGK